MIGDDPHWMQPSGGLGQSVWQGVHTPEWHTVFLQQGNSLVLQAIMAELQRTVATL
jgi:hypothetical protein